MASTELWSNDLFDRESDPLHEGTWECVERGLAALWARVLSDGVQANGQPTFTAFHLRVPGRPAVFIPRDPFKNPELALLRARRLEVDFSDRLGRVHAARLDAAFDFAPLLALPVQLPAEVEVVVSALCSALSIAEPLTRGADAWRAGPEAGPRVELTGARISGGGYDSAMTAWWVKLAGLRFEGKPVRFEVTIEDVDHAGWTWRTECDETAATQPLLDALASTRR